MHPEQGPVNHPQPKLRVPKPWPASLLQHRQAAVDFGLWTTLPLVLHPCHSSCLALHILNKDACGASLLKGVTFRYNSQRQLVSRQSDLCSAPRHSAETHKTQNIELRAHGNWSE